MTLAPDDQRVIVVIKPRSPVPPQIGPALDSLRRLKVAGREGLAFGVFTTKEQPGTKARSDGRSHERRADAGDGRRMRRHPVRSGASDCRCADVRRGDDVGGDWPAYGHDLANSRSQPAEHGISPSAATTLAPAWSFYEGVASGPLGGNLSDFNSTPTEFGGCVYVASAQSTAGVPNVYALNADSGQVVWKLRLNTVTPGLGGAIVAAVTISGRNAYVLVNQKGDGATHGPYVVALDRLTGHTVWTSMPVVTADGYYSNATPTVADGVVVAGFSATEGDPFGHGGVGLLDARTGKILTITYTVPPSQWGTAAEPLYAGGGVWTTPAADAASGYAYMGSGNPYSKKIQYPRTDALLKLDINRHRSTFGQIVAYYPGNIDQLLPLLQTLSKPTCDLLPDDPLRTLPLPLPPQLQSIKDLVGNSPGCLQLDQDFGAAANLFHAADGRLVVGDLQKSGIYHAAYASDMKPAWMSLLGVTCPYCNASSTAYASGSIFSDTFPGTIVTSVSSSGGRLKWLSLVGDGVHFESVSTADGVVYTTDGLGFLDAFRADNGFPLLRRSLVLDGGLDALPPSGVTSDGIAVARHTVYVEEGSHVFAYRPKSLLPGLGGR